MTDLELTSRRATRPLVSVVVSTRNHAPWLSQMTGAVLDQDLDDEMELIVCDNASTDATEQIMRRVVEQAARPVTYLRLTQDLGAAAGRNLGLSRARGAFVAFTDSDCVPSRGWLRSALAGFVSDRIGIVQGKTAPTLARTRLFSHHIETDRLDGHFSTSNVIYRRRALGRHRFDSRCWYWEDTDLGWRVLGDGWLAAFAERAQVAHQVVPLSPLRWLLWPRRLGNWPAKASRYPGFRRHLFLRIWARPLNACFELALVGLILSRRRKPAVLLTLPYLATFFKVRALNGRFPPAKLAAHVAWDTVAVLSLLAGSIRHRALVL